MINVNFFLSLEMKVRDDTGVVNLFVSHEETCWEMTENIG